MADISMCKGTTNVLCKTCYRRTAPVNPYYQAWFKNPPIKENTCEYYWEK